MLLEDRWNDIYVPSNDQYFCQDGCKFESYNINLFFYFDDNLFH